MSLKRKSYLTFPKDPHVNQAFRSPFRSPRPSSDNADSPKFSAVGQASENRAADSSSCDSQTSKEEIITDQLIGVTPSKALALTNNTTPQNSSGRHHKFSRKLLPRQFTSPFQSPRNILFQPRSETPEKELANLIQQEVDLDNDIAALKKSGFKVEELQVHIDNLHRYNEVKDAAQIVLGRLAEIEQVTLKEMHKKYDVPVSE